MGSNTEKKLRYNVQNLYKYEAKKLRATTFGGTNNISMTVQ